MMPIRARERLSWGSVGPISWRMNPDGCPIKSRDFCSAGFSRRIVNQLFGYAGYEALLFFDVTKLARSM